MLKPVLIGAAMAAMVLWMGHGRIMSGEISLTAGAVLFVLAHVAVLVFVLGAAMFVPQLRRFALRHRPSVRHIGLMMMGMSACAAGIHSVMHGSVL